MNEVTHFKNYKVTKNINQAYDYKLLFPERIKLYILLWFQDNILLLAQTDFEELSSKQEPES